MDSVDNTKFSRLWYIYSEALKSNCFIFDKSINKWYTPEEFREIYEKKEMSHTFISGLLCELVIRDPIAGIQAAHKQLDQRLEAMKKDTERDRLKLAEFTKMAIQYYQGKAGKQTKR